MLQATSTLTGQAISLQPGQVISGVLSPAAAASTGLTFPDPLAVLDLDFISQQYWWNGSIRTTANFTTYALNGSTFGANGLTPTATIDVSLNVSGFWSSPGAYAARLYLTSTPGTNRIAFNLSTGVDTQSIGPYQWTVAGQIRTLVTATTLQAQPTTAGSINAATGIASSFDTNDVRAARDGVSAAADTTANMPVPTILRVGKGNSASTEFLGAIGRIVLYDSVQNDAWLQDRSTRIKT